MAVGIGYGFSALETIFPQPHDIPLNAVLIEDCQTRHLTGGRMPFDPDRFAETLLAGMADAIIYADKAGLIRIWNKGAVRIFGFTEQEALGRSLDIIIPASLHARHWQGYHETMRMGQTRYGDGQILSVPAVRKDGTRISVEFTIVPFLDEDGAMAGIAAVMRDVTAQFEEMRSLRKQLLALRVAAQPDGESIVPSRE